MQSPKKTKLLIGLVGVVLGGILIGAGWFVYWLRTAHHYSEIETFFRGPVAGKEVLGISYFDYHGSGFMELNQWKVLLRDPNSGLSTTIYHNRPGFQEPIPYQPKIEIKSNTIYIDDGESKLETTVGK